jgi:hypothetical protein
MQASLSNSIDIEVGSCVYSHNLDYVGIPFYEEVHKRWASLLKQAIGVIYHEAKIDVNALVEMIVEGIEGEDKGIK